MEHILNIAAITPATKDWTCKVQVVDKFRPRESKDQRTHFQIIIVQDEQEEQICIILYGDDIGRYDKMFKLFNTYLISSAKVREQKPYSLRVNKYEWVVDSFTTVDCVEKHDEREAVLRPPTKLSTVSFLDLERQPLGVEFDLLAVVVNCGTMKYTANQAKRFQEAIVMDSKRKPFLFIIWEDRADNEGTTLLKQLQEYPIIAARRIAVTEFRNVRRLSTRYNSTILIDPPYIQVPALRNWVKANDGMLKAYTLKSLSESPSSLNVAPIEDDILLISAIASHSTQLQTFYVEGEILLPNELQDFYVLVCSECKHHVRYKLQREIQCINCNLRRMLVPSNNILYCRCQFEIEIADPSGATRAIVSDNLAEKLLSLTAEQIYNIVAAKNELLPVEHINQQFKDKLFRLQLQKSLSRTADKNAGTLIVLSYTPQEILFCPESSTSTSTDNGSKKQKMEPTTPPKAHHSV